MRTPFRALTLVLLLLVLSACAATQGRVADGRYYSARGWFDVPVPKSSNFAQVPFSIQDKSLNNSEANFEIVVFSVKDFGEILIAGVDYFADDFIETRMKQDSHRTVLSHLADMALRFNPDVAADSARSFPTRPKVLEESYLSTLYGEALLRTYKAEKGSFLVRATGRRPTPEDTFDTLIAVIVAMQKNDFIYAIAENDAEGQGTDGNKEVLTRRAQSFFAGVAVHR
jgi:hypothetical protein